MDMNIKNGVRWSTSAAYLKPVSCCYFYFILNLYFEVLDRPNLITSYGILCTGLLFHKNQAIGIEFIRQKQTYMSSKLEPASREKIYCEGAVILAGGAINTPQLLMVSGVGPGKHIKVIIFIE